MNKIQSQWFFPMAAALIFGAALPGYAQDPSQSAPSPGGWRKFGEPNPNRPPVYANPGPDQDAPDQPGAYQEPPNQPPPAGRYPNSNVYQNRGYGSRPLDVPPPPPVLAVAPGSWITIRVDQPLSSNHNQPGDTFTATLTQPLVADGRVVARRGQMVVGRVTEVETVTRSKGLSRLGLEITEVSLVNGQQVPVHTQFIERRGESSTGDNVAAIGATTGIGAAIGAAAAGGVGAGVGAIAGAAASTIGVLVAHGKPAVVYPESVLTFRLVAPVNISTERSEMAFEPVSREDYDRAPTLRQGPPRPAYGPGPGYYPSYPMYGGYYSPWYGAYAFGPSFYFYSGPRFYGGRGYRRW